MPTKGFISDNEEGAIPSVDYTYVVEADVVTPGVNQFQTYMKSDHVLYGMDSDRNVYLLGGGSVGGGSSVYRVPATVVATSNVTVAAPGASIDGYSLTSGDRVLLTGQSSGVENGLWTWTGAATPMTRTADYESGNTEMAFAGVTVFILNGTIGAGQTWRLTTTGTITIDTNSTSWTQNAATFTDSLFKLEDNSDQTKKAQFQLSGITTGNTRVYTVPDYDATFATLAGSEVFANKTLTTPTIADFTNATHSHQNAAGGGSLDAAAIGSGTLANARVNWASPDAIGTGTPAAGTFTALAATTGTFTDIVNITKTTQQLSLNYDGSNKAAFTVSGGGDLTIAPTGLDLNITGSTNVTASRTDAADGTAGVQGTFTSTLTTSSTSILSGGLFAMNGTSAAFSEARLWGVRATATYNATAGTITEVVGISTNASTSASSTGTPTSIFGISATALHGGSGVVTNLRGISATVNMLSTAGNATTVDSISTTFSQAGSGNTVTTYNGLRVGPPTSTGTVTTANGLNLGNMGRTGITNANGLVMPAMSGAATSNIFVLLGASSATGSWTIHATTTNDSALAGKLMLGSTTAPTTTSHVITSDSGTNAVVNVSTITHNSNGSIAANFGVGSLWAGQDTTTASVEFGRIRWYWSTATHASRKANGVLSAYDTAERDCIFWGASGSAPMISFLSVTTPIVQTTAWTQTYSTSSHTTANPTATSVTTTASTQTTPWGYSTQAQADDIITELNRLITDVANVKNNVNGIIDDLQAYGLFG